MPRHHAQLESLWRSVGSWVLAAGTALALIAAPITIAPDLLGITWQAALGHHKSGHSPGGGKKGSDGDPAPDDPAPDGQAGPVDCSTGALAPVDQYSIALSTLATGPYAADSLSPNFLNPSGQVFTNTYWGVSLPTKYFRSDSYLQFSAQSKYCSRDMEVHTWSRNGVVFLRKTDDGSAIYFYHNGELTDGRIEIGLATDLSEADWYGTRFPLYLGDFRNVANYDRMDTEDDYFTFGVEGFDIYAKLDGIEFVRIREYRHMDHGRVAIRANDGYGFRSVTVNHLLTKELYSDYANGIIDLRDFGLREIATPGSIDAGSQTLMLTADVGFRAGDQIIVEIGGEPGGGRRGTRGVGGSWPTQSYVSYHAMAADTSQPDGLYAWVETTGDIYRWVGGVWQQQSSNYYVSKAIPRALNARVLSITDDGRQLTLDKVADVASENAAVYFDNAPIVNKLARRPQYDGEMNFPKETWPNSFEAITPSNVTLHFPVGSYAVGQTLLLQAHDGWAIEGAGQQATHIFSPDGTPSGRIWVHESPRTVVRNLHLEGNARDEGYGLWFSKTIDGGGRETIPPRGWTFPEGILFNYGSNYSRAEDVLVTDVFQKAVGASFSEQVWGYRVENVMTEGLRAYIQWQFQWADAVGGGCVDCSVTSPYLIAGFEAFKSKDVQFIRPWGVNATMAMNSAGNFLIEDATLIIEPMSQHPDKAFSEYNPIVNINSNIGSDHPFLALGGKIVNIEMTQLGFINEDNATLRGIVVNSDNPSIQIIGGYYQAPDWTSPSQLPGPNGVDSTGRDTTVDGMEVVGTVNLLIYPRSNIRVEHGAVRNCVGEVVIVEQGTIEDCVCSVCVEGSVLMPALAVERGR